MMLIPMIVAAVATLQSPTHDPYVEAANAFGFDLLSYCAQGNRSENSLVSPLSAHFLLSAALLGASGPTDGALANALGVRALGPDGLKQSLNTIAAETQNWKDSLRMANGMWLFPPAETSPGVEVLYRDQLGVELRRADSVSAGVDEINAWANEQTKERIKKVFESLSELSTFVLINATTFDGQWPKELRPTGRVDKFRASSGPVAARFLETTGTLPYVATDRYRAVLLPYKDARFALAVVVPNEGSDIRRILPQFKGEEWRRLVSAEPKHGDVLLPKFRVAARADLLGFLASRGADLRGRVDFGKIASKSWQVEMSHQAVIEVDEQGTRAAAVTAIGANSGGGVSRPQPEMFVIVADRPFFYAVVDRQSGLLVFCGVLNRP